jgi:hypothetical protein
MKIRAGFCSNSSSSSFCIYGVYTEDGDLVKSMDNNEFDNALSKANFDFYHLDGLDGYYIGRELTSMKEDETMREFKKRVEEDLQKILEINENCSFFQESWYDG